MRVSGLRWSQRVSTRRRTATDGHGYAPDRVWLVSEPVSADADSAAVRGNGRQHVDRVMASPTLDTTARQHRIAGMRKSRPQRVDGLCKNRGMSQTSLLPREMYSEAEAALVGSRRVTCGGE